MAIAPSPSWTGLWPAYILASARAASMRFAAEAGRSDEAAQAFEEIMVTGRTFSYQGSGGAYGAAARLQRVGLAELRHELMEHPFPEPVCARLLASIERWPLADSDLTLECERLDLHGRIQQVFTDNGRGDGHRVAGGAAPLSIDQVRDAFARRFMLPTRREEFALTDEAIDAAIVDVSVRLNQSTAATRDIQKEMADRHAVAARAFHTAASVLEEAARHRTEVETTRLALALSIFRARHGRLPARLDELVPGVLSGLPSDPATGAPFGYRRLEDDPHGRPYEIYSFGPDGVDNAGHYDSRPQHERRRDAEGFDELLTPPRPPPR